MRNICEKLDERGDVEAAHKLVTSYLRLVAKIAMGYRAWPARSIHRRNVGMICGRRNSDPEKGFRRYLCNAVD